MCLCMLFTLYTAFARKNWPSLWTIPTWHIAMNWKDDCLWFGQWCSTRVRQCTRVGPESIFLRTRTQTRALRTQTQIQTRRTTDLWCCHILLLATPRTHEVSALIQFSSAFSPPSHLTFGSRALGFPLRQFEIHYLSVSVNLSHFLLSDVISRHFIFNQPTLFQLPILPRISSSTRPDSSKTWHYTSHLLTYLQQDDRYVSAGDLDLWAHNLQPCKPCQQCSLNCVQR